MLEGTLERFHHSVGEARCTMVYAHIDDLVDIFSFVIKDKIEILSVKAQREPIGIF